MSNRNWIFLAGLVTGVAVVWRLRQPIFHAEVPLITLDSETLIALQGIDPEKLDAFIAEAQAEQA